MLYISILATGFLSGSVVKNLPAYAGTAGDMGLISGLGRYPEEGNGTPLQYSCLGNTMNFPEEPGKLEAMGLQTVGHD